MTSIRSMFGRPMPLDKRRTAYHDGDDDGDDGGEDLTFKVL